VSRFVLAPEHPLRGLEMQGLGTLVAEVFGTFLETTPTYVREMRAAHGRGDASELVSLAHSLKGAAVQVGAEDLAELCARVQSAGRGDDMAGVAALLVALESAFEGLRRTLEPQRERLSQAALP
jgi:HPt (histidine-containing phosphotransfer) domain-containing protein